jgi:hypothetical protein
MLILFKINKYVVFGFYMISLEDALADGYLKAK